MAGLGVIRRWRGGRSSLGATVNRVGTDVSVGIATATEEAAKQAGSLAGTAVSVTGSIVVGGASLLADGAVTLVNVATGPPRHALSRPAPRKAASTTTKATKATKAQPTAGQRSRRESTARPAAPASGTRRGKTSRTASGGRSSTEARGTPKSS